MSPIVNHFSTRECGQPVIIENDWQLNYCSLCSITLWCLGPEMHFEEERKISFWKREVFYVFRWNRFSDRQYFDIFMFERYEYV